jgi:hypothetical protein
MADERQRIQKLLADDKISSEEARRLTDALEKAELREQASGSREALSRITKLGTLGVFYYLFAVALPLATLLFELLRGLCAEFLFDPLPTLWHILLVVWVPAANLFVGIQLYRGTERLRPVAWANGSALGVSLFYCLLFLPLVPIGFIGILFFGAGFLLLAPLFSTLAAIFARLRINEHGRLWQMRRVPGLWRGFGTAAGLLILLALPTTVTRLGLDYAVSDVSGDRLRGIRILRNLGSRDVLLRACYERSSPAIDPLGFGLMFGQHVSNQQARDAYYRVYGETFNAVPPPERLAGRGLRTNLSRFEFDADQGGTKVGGRIRDLKLSASRWDGFILPDAVASYVEWTMVFTNNDPRAPHEARALILLPPEGVVSRLTLWIDGEEREATFAAVGQVREAYQNVVQQRRDPVLITTAGMDRILVQCYPVPAGGGSMKIRFGVTAPLVLADAKHGQLWLPRVLEQNFNNDPELLHLTRIESKREFQLLAEDLAAEKKDENGFFLRTDFSVERIRTAPVLFQTTLPDGIETIVAEETRTAERGWVRQTVVARLLEAPRRIVLVLDGSQAMAAHFPRFAELLNKLPPSAEIGLLIAGDEVADLGGRMACRTSAERDVLAEKLRNFVCVGGADNLPALNRAVDLTKSSDQAAVLWLHAMQPAGVSPRDHEALQQRFMWEGGPAIFHLQFGGGPNRILEKIDDRRFVTLRPGGRPDALERLLELWNGQVQKYELRRTREPDLTETEAPLLRDNSGHVVRLWARAESERLAGVKKTVEAVRLAVAHKLVTSVTGAVVLETQAQYAAAGLEPGNAEDIPSVPEPEVWALIIVIAAFLLWLYGRRIWRGRLAGA